MVEYTNQNDQENPPNYTGQIIEDEKSHFPTVIIILSFLLLLSGFSVYAFIAAFQEESREKKGVEFPFEREVSIMFTSPKDVLDQIKNFSVRNSASHEVLEIVFQDQKGVLFLTDMLGDLEKEMSKELKSNINSFSVGVHKGRPFVLTTFNNDAFFVMSSHSKEFFQAMEIFTGKENLQEIKRVQKANTDIVIMNNNIIYGFLNKNTIFIAKTEEFFLEMLDFYRSFYQKSLAP